MSMRLATPCLPAAVLLFAGLPQQAVQAKPPELPIRQKIVCQEQAIQTQPSSGGEVEATVTDEGELTRPLSLLGNNAIPKQAEPLDGTLILRVGLNSDAGLIAGFAFGANRHDGSHCGYSEVVSLCLGYLLTGLGYYEGFGCVEINTEFSLAKSVELVLGPDRRALPTTRVSPPETTCPYLRCQQAAKAAAPAQAAEPSTTVLENLRKLEEAQAAYQEAEAHRHKGQTESACQCYDKARKLCPGSRYDRLAAAHLKQLQAAQVAANAASGEEQEPPVAEEHKPVKEAAKTPHESPCTFLYGRFHLAGCNVMVNLNSGGHGSMLFGLGMETVLGGVPFQIYNQYQQLKPLFSAAVVK
jgi:hypothetical protein